MAFLTLNLLTGENKMKKKLIVSACFILTVSGLLMIGCAEFLSRSAPLSESNFAAPVVALDSMEVSHAFGYWYFSKKVKPTKGKPDNVGAPLELAFLFNIINFQYHVII